MSSHFSIIELITILVYRSICSANIYIYIYIYSGVQKQLDLGATTPLRLEVENHTAVDR
jgi:hypothetical protein